MLESKITVYIQSIYKVQLDTRLIRYNYAVTKMRLRRLHKRVYGLKNGLFKKTTH